jgi:voltage-gated potassium channel
MKHEVYKFLNEVDDDKRLNFFFHFFMGILISSNVLAVILETIPSLNQKYVEHFYYFEFFSVIVFSLEYILRLWSCTIIPAYSSRITGRIKYSLIPLSIIDLVAILPFYLPLIISLDLRFIWVLRMLRLFRLFKLERYSESFRLIVKVFQKKSADIAVCLLFITTIMVVTSALMYHAEHAAQPDAFSSIPATMWWCVITLTTVGYGDIYPITPLGKILGGFIALLGIGLFALPTGILASGFSDELQNKQVRNLPLCPHCGKPLKNNLME